jgi:hypothetical protein
MLIQEITVIHENAAIRLFGGAAIVGTLMLSAACGGSGGGGTSSTQKGQGNGGDNAMAAYRQCMQKQGVTMPSGGPGGGGNGGVRPSGRPSGQPSGQPSGRPSGRPSGMPSMSDKQKKAAQACASLRPQGGSGGPGGGNQPGS